MSTPFDASAEYARRLDAEDPLRKYRDEFLFPTAVGPAGHAEPSPPVRAEPSRSPNPSHPPLVYFAGNSLGLQPRKAKQYVLEELEDWERFGVEGHFRARHPWLPYHENLTAMTARLVGAQPHEVVVMNTLTVNLHLMMVSFYRPTKERFRILIEDTAFPSDSYAVASQARFHGFDPREAILRLKPREGELTLRPEDILETIEREGDSIALVMLGNVNYLSGQAFDMKAITRAAHAKGCKVGFDLAHAAGNLLLTLHDDGPDFAVWCSYKYLNGGPGTLAGAFVHERHAKDKTLPRFEGWWGHQKTTRFKMGPDFEPLEGAEAWQLSNPPILQLAALRASMELFDAATMPALRRKSEALTGYLEKLLETLPSGFVTVLTPRDPKQRGAQLSLRIRNGTREYLHSLEKDGVICDFREPDIIRAAPAPLYCSFSDVHRFVEVLRTHAAD